MARPGQPDISEAALLFEPLEAVLFDRAQAGKEPFLPTRQKHRIEFEPLGAVQGHQIDHVAGAVGGVVHDQADMFEKPGEVLELGHRDNQLLQVFEAARRVG